MQFPELPLGLLGFFLSVLLEGKSSNFFVVGNNASLLI
jgi:hypothetical protein